MVRGVVFILSVKTRTQLLSTTTIYWTLSEDQIHCIYVAVSLSTCSPNQRDALDVRQRGAKKVMRADVPLVTHRMRINFDKNKLDKKKNRKNTRHHPPILS